MLSSEWWLTVILELQPESQSITRAPLMRKDLDGAVANSLSSPATVLHRYGAYHDTETTCMDLTTNSLRRSASITLIALH